MLYSHHWHLSALPGKDSFPFQPCMLLGVGGEHPGAAGVSFPEVLALMDVPRAQGLLCGQGC